MGFMKNALKKLNIGEKKKTEPERITLEEYYDGQKEKGVGREGSIGREWCKDANDLLQIYKNDKAVLDEKTKAAYEWYRQRYWKIIKTVSVDTKNAPEPTTAWLFNSICNKHADAMDSFPQSVFLPRSQDDEKIAAQLGPIVAAIKDECRYLRVYDKKWWDKLIAGVGVTGVFWDFRKHGGAGGIEIRNVSILNLFWKGKVDDIQKSPYVFEVERVDRESLVEEYPFLEDKMLTVNKVAEEFETEEHTSDDFDVTVVHAWYKKAGKLHYCKYCNEEVLYASENDPRFQNCGYYMHGEFPFHPDRLYPLEDTIAGMGYVYLFNSCQMYIDKMEQAMLENVIANAKPRIIVSDAAGINTEEYCDLNCSIVHAERLDERAIQPVKFSELGGAAFSMLADKINEMKETSSNRDFGQGSVSSGVTSGAAISALQEASSKTSRDMIKASYDVECRIDEQIINLLRQFMTLPQFFRVVGEDKKTQYVEFDNRGLLPQQRTAKSGEIYNKLPVFDIKIKAQKQSPFSTLEENERIMAMFQMGMFNPELSSQALVALEGMNFEGKEELMVKIQQNGTLQSQIMALAQENQMLKAQLGMMPQAAPGQGMTI